MSLQNGLCELENKIFRLGANVYSNEESTKQGLILPYLNLMGYDYLDVSEVNPEYPVRLLNNVSTSSNSCADSNVESDLGKIDYLLKVGDFYHILEAKKFNKPLIKSINQIKSYFDNTVGSRIGILSDGNVYMFFSDFDEIGIMDSRPFLVYSLINNFRNNKVEVLSNLYRLSRFDKFYVSANISKNDLRYISEYNDCIKNLIELNENGFLTSKEFLSLKNLLNF